MELRPREKLLAKGPAELTNSELLAIVLNTGYKGEKVLNLSRRILKEYGTKALTSEKDVRNLMANLRLPQVKACQITAVFELGRRLFDYTNRTELIINNPEDVFNYLKPMTNLKQEQLRGLYLNMRNQVVRDEILYIGNLTSTIVEIREVFRPAIEYGCYGFILAHNHPFGDFNPSPEDVKVTNKIYQASDLLQIKLLDHIIVSERGFFSFMQRAHS